MIIKLITLLVLLVTFYFHNPVFAQSNSFLTQSELQQSGIDKYENINPNSIVYPFKRYIENLRLQLTFDSLSKQQYLWKLYSGRFKELVYIINFDKTGFLLETVDRYNTSVGRTKNQMSTLSLQQKEQINNNLKLLEKLRDRYHSGSAYWSKIQESVDTTRSLI